jgi:hypothetical protein
MPLPFDHYGWTESRDKKNPAVGQGLALYKIAMSGE